MSSQLTWFGSLHQSLPRFFCAFVGLAFEKRLNISVRFESVRQFVWQPECFVFSRVTFHLISICFVYCL